MRDLFILVMEALALYGAFYMARWAYRRHTEGPRTLSDEDRRTLATLQSASIKRELSRRGDVSREYHDAQSAAYMRLWRSMRPATMELAPPEKLDPAVDEHINFAMTVVGDYDSAREEAGSFSDCLYRPASDLPYPQAGIRKCCEFLISIAERPEEAVERFQKSIAAERDALGFALFSLDYFLDLPASEIPRHNVQNLAFVKRQFFAGAKAPAKPEAGHLVVSVTSGSSDTIAQVIGLGGEDQWLVLTTSGTPMEVVYNADFDRWEQVQVIAPAAASWLSLSPPAGMPALG